MPLAPRRCDCFCTRGKASFPWEKDVLVVRPASRNNPAADQIETKAAADLVDCRIFALGRPDLPAVTPVGPARASGRQLTRGKRVRPDTLPAKQNSTVGSGWMANDALGYPHAGAPSGSKPQVQLCSLSLPASLPTIHPANPVSCNRRSPLAPNRQKYEFPRQPELFGPGLVRLSRAAERKPGPRRKHGRLNVPRGLWATRFLRPSRPASSSCFQTSTSSRPGWRNFPVLSARPLSRSLRRNGLSPRAGPPPAPPLRFPGFDPGYLDSA